MRQQMGLVDVFFPMAGQGARFGHRFKPFLTVDDVTFIEAAVQPFRPFASKISRFVFVYLAAQERDFSVSRRLSNLFAGLPIECVQLDTQTRGPAETIGRAVEQLGARGKVFLCDCDHALDVAPLFAVVDAGEPFDALLPVWPLDHEDIASWSVAMVAADRVLAIAEKQLPVDPRGASIDPAGEAPRTAGNAPIDPAGKAPRTAGNAVGVPTPRDLASPIGVAMSAPMGVIGCYGFADVADVAARAASLGATNFSEVIAAMLAEGRIVRAARIEHARFFGDPERLEKATRGAR